MSWVRPWFDARVGERMRSSGFLSQDQTIAGVNGGRVRSLVLEGRAVTGAEVGERFGLTLPDARTSYLGYTSSRLLLVFRRGAYVAPLWADVSTVSVVQSKELSYTINSPDGSPLLAVCWRPLFATTHETRVIVDQLNEARDAAAQQVQGLLAPASAGMQPGGPGPDGIDEAAWLIMTELVGAARRGDPDRFRAAVFKLGRPHLNKGQVYFYLVALTGEAIRRRFNGQPTVSELTALADALRPRWQGITAENAEKLLPCMLLPLGIEHSVVLSGAGINVPALAVTYALATDTKHPGTELPRQVVSEYLAANPHIQDLPWPPVPDDHTSP